MRLTDPDSIDLAALREAVGGAGYQLIRQRQEEQRAALLRELVTAKSWDDVRFLQGQIQAVDRALQLPKIIDSEIRAKQKRNGISEPD